jgi:hypothetical protein
MKTGLKQIVWLFMAILVAVQAVVPSLAMAEITMRCASQSAMSAPCFHAVVSLTQGHTNELMGKMPCCMDRSAVAPIRPPSSSPTINNRHCIVSISWTNAGRHAPALVKLTHRPRAATPELALSLSAAPCHWVHSPLSCTFADTSPVVPISNVFLTSHGLRAPPIA